MFLWDNGTGKSMIRKGKVKYITTYKSVLAMVPFLKLKGIECKPERSILLRSNNSKDNH